MSIDPIGFIAPLHEPQLAALGAAPATPAPGFGALFGSQLSEVNGQLHDADRALVELASGQARSLHDVMLRMEQAHLSFQMLAQVRNRMLEAYQEVIRMPL